MPVFDPFSNSAAIQGSTILNISDRDAISIPGSKTLAEQYFDYVTGLAPLLWLRLRETSGTTVANSGSVAASGTWTPGVGAVGQTGRFGANEAYDFDALDSKIQFTSANIAALNSLTTQRWAFLLNADSLGETGNGILALYGNDFGHHFVRLASSNRLVANIETSGTDGSAITSNDEVSDLIGGWRWIFMDYDDGDAMGLGRKIRLFKSVPGSGVITPLALGTDIPATGTITTQTADLVIGNFTGQTRTFDGKMDEVIIQSGLWTTAIMQQISLLTPA